MELHTYIGETVSVMHIKGQKGLCSIKKSSFHKSFFQWIAYLLIISYYSTVFIVLAST